MIYIIRVRGKAIIELPWVVDLEVDDITTTAMTIRESDELISEAIFEKYGHFVDDITVNTFEKIDESE